MDVQGWQVRLYLRHDAPTDVVDAMIARFPHDTARTVAAEADRLYEPVYRLAHKYYPTPEQGEARPEAYG